MHNLTLLIFESSSPWCIAHSGSSAGSCRPFQCRTRDKDWKQCLPSIPWRPLCCLSVKTHTKKHPLNVVALCSGTKTLCRTNRSRPDCTLWKRADWDCLIHRHLPSFRRPRPAPSIGRTGVCWWRHTVDGRVGTKWAHSGLPEFSLSFFRAFKYPFIVQFHGEVPIETAIFGVVACSEVLPDPIVPGFGY